MTRPWPPGLPLITDVPTTGYPKPGAPLRAFAVQFRIDLDALGSVQDFDSSLRAVLDRHVEPYRQEGQATLVVFPETIGLLSLLAGPLGTHLASVMPQMGPPDPGQPGAQLLGVIGAASAQMLAADADASPGLADPRKAIFLAAANQLGKAFCEQFSRLAYDYGIYLVAGAYMPNLAYDPVTETYSPDGTEVYNQTMLWGPRTTRQGGQPWRSNLLFTNYKIPLTDMERDLLGIDEGPATGNEAHANAGYVEVEGLKLGFATSLPAFAYGYPYGERPAGFDPWEDLEASYAAAQDAAGVDVMIQADANAGLWATLLENGAWQPLEWMSSTWRAVADPTVNFRYNITPMLTGNLLDLPYDGQSSITKRLDEGDPLLPARSYVGNRGPLGDAPAEYEVYRGDKHQFAALAPWVVPDGNQEELAQVSLGLLPGLGSPWEGKYVQTALYADLVPAPSGGATSRSAVQVIAHRGASSTHPEHTRRAYQHALDIGADGIEIDVHRTADGHVVCFHDQTVDRTTDGTGPVAAHTLAQLREMNLRDGDGWVSASDQIVTLPELLDMMCTTGRPLTLAIELKHPNAAGTGLDRAVLQVLADVGWNPADSALGNVSISLMSFNPESYFLAKEVGATAGYCALIADLSVEQITRDLGVKDKALIGQVQAALAGTLSLIDAGMVPFAGPSYDYMLEHGEALDRWIKAGTGIRVWTVDHADQVDECLRRGVTQITTNDPGLVLDYLRGQGLHG